MWFSLILMIHGIFAVAIHNENVLNFECETNFNCTKYVANSMCFNKKCICPFGYTSGGCVAELKQMRYRRQMVKDMRMLGEPCDWTTQCRRIYTDQTKICLARICQCSYGYISLDAYRCIRETVTLPSNVRIAKAIQNEPPGFGSKCLTTADCQQISMHLECIHEVCECLEGYVPLGKYLCYSTRQPEHAIMTLSQFSTTSTDTPSISNDALKPLGKIGNSCFNDYFCRRTIPESHCYNGKCACIDGYTSIDQYTCMKDVNRDTTTKPIPESFDYKSLLGGKCVTKRNCHTSNALCLNFTCSCPKGYFPVDDWTCFEEPESSDEELIETAPVILTTNPMETTASAAKMFSTTTSFRWWPWSPTTYPTLFDAENTFRVRCLLNRQCASMDSNSHCTLFGRCVCNRGFILKTTTRGQFCTPRVLNQDDCD